MTRDRSTKQIPLFCFLLCLVLVQAGAQQLGEEFDMQRVRELRNKSRAGKTLTPEEEAYWRRFNQWRRKRLEAFRNEHPPRESTGLVPLTELGSAPYKGTEGGLYPGGRNQPPESHRRAGLELATRVQPLDAEGRPSGEGKIVLLSIGMSNTTQEFRVFKELADADPAKNPHLLIVDGAQGGQSAEVTADPAARFWRVIDERLAAADAGAKQVQVAWVKQAIQRPSRPFPQEVKTLQNHLLTNLQIMAERFPNLKIVYLSSRIYAGYAETPLSPEPHAYEDGFAVKWLIADQIAGKPELNHDPRKGSVRTPWLAWGPYLWADGVKGRGDGLTYLREDLAEDGTHPSMSGRKKVAKLLLAFLKSDPTARLWFLRPGKT